MKAIQWNGCLRVDQSLNICNQYWSGPAFGGYWRWEGWFFFFSPLWVYLGKVVSKSRISQSPQDQAWHSWNGEPLVVQGHLRLDSGCLVYDPYMKEFNWEIARVCETGVDKILEVWLKQTFRIECTYISVVCFTKEQSVLTFENMFWVSWFGIFTSQASSTDFYWISHYVQRKIVDIIGDTPQRSYLQPPQPLKLVVKWEIQMGEYYFKTQSKPKPFFSKLDVRKTRAEMRSRNIHWKYRSLTGMFRKIFKKEMSIREGFECWK